MKQPIFVEIAIKTDDGISRKGHNEDNFSVVAQNWGHAVSRVELSERGAVLVVADGMGGTNAGEVASQIAIKSIESSIHKLTRVFNSDRSVEDYLINTLEMAHNNIVQHAKTNHESAGMGTTAVIVWLLNAKAHIAWCGDSRCYIYRKGVPFRPRTDDHSLVWQEIVGDNFTAEKAEAARLHPDSNIITQSLGDDAQPPKPSSKTVELQTGDRIIVCSDGLNSMVSDRDIGAIVSRLDFSPKQICDQLIIAANAAGGTDNITVITADFDVNNYQMAAQTPPVDFQESTSATNTKMKNIFLGILGGLLLAIAGWYFLIQSPKLAAEETAALNAAAKKTQDSLDLVKKNQKEKFEDNVSKSDVNDRLESHKTPAAPPKKESVTKGGKTVQDGKFIGPQDAPKGDLTPVEKPATDPKLIKRMTELKSKRSDIGDFLLKFPDQDKLIGAEKVTYQSLKSEATAIHTTLKDKGIITKEGGIVETYNNESVISDLEKQVKALHSRVEKWCSCKI